MGEEISIKKTMIFPLSVLVYVLVVFEVMFSVMFGFFEIVGDIKWIHWGSIGFFALFSLLLLKSTKEIITVTRETIKEENVSNGDIRVEFGLKDTKRIYKDIRSGRSYGDVGESINEFVVVIESNDGQEIVLNRLLYKPRDIRKVVDFIVKHSPHIKNDM